MWRDFVRVLRYRRAVEVGLILPRELEGQLLVTSWSVY